MGVVVPLASAAVAVVVVVEMNMLLDAFPIPMTTRSEYSVTMRIKATMMIH